MQPTTRRRRGSLSALVVLALLVPLSGCGGGRTITAGGAEVLVSEDIDEGMAALARGRLDVVGGCLGLDDYIVVWPHGTEVVDDEPLTVEVPEYGTFSRGEDVEIGGGLVLEHSSDDVVPGPQEVGGVTVPAACAQHDVFLAY